MKFYFRSEIESYFRSEIGRGGLRRAGPGAGGSAAATASSSSLSSELSSPSHVCMTCRIMPRPSPAAGGSRTEVVSFGRISVESQYTFTPSSPKAQSTLSLVQFIGTYF